MSVRLVLELHLPEVEDLVEKGVFSKSEATAIMRRRSDFEHRILGGGVKPRDYIKYSVYESNLEKLRLKRAERLQTENPQHLQAFRRITFIFSRAVRRFPADLDLWGKYIDYVKLVDAVRAVYSVYAKLLSLQPRNVDAWVSAAKYEFDVNANALGARELFQRGLKINPESEHLWLLYALFELAYVSKLLARRKVLGLLTPETQIKDMEEQKAKQESKELNADMIAVDEETAPLSLPQSDLDVLGNPDTNPVLRGEIALAIFDTALVELAKNVPKDHQPKHALDFISRFLDMLDKFALVKRDALYAHVAQLAQAYSGDRAVLIEVTLPLRGAEVGDADFARKMSELVALYKKQPLALLRDLYGAYLRRFCNDSEQGTIVKGIIDRLPDA